MIGNGSDLVVADAGIRGLVIRNRARGVTVDGLRLEADAGAPMALLVRTATTAGLAGLEFGTSIPGTLGGAVWANAGAHGSEMRDVVATVEAWDPREDADLHAGRGRLRLRLPRVALQAPSRGDPLRGGHAAPR